jgi:hypothetical protein
LQKMFNAKPVVDGKVFPGFPLQLASFFLLIPEV